MIAPSSIQFSNEYGTPNEMTKVDIKRDQASFVAAAERAAFAGIDMIELHGAHGYLINQFLSPLTNERTDAYGGSLENRYLFAKEIIEQIRGSFNGSLWIRLSLAAYDDSEKQNSLNDWKTIGKWLEKTASIASTFPQVGFWTRNRTSPSAQPIKSLTPPR